MATIKSHTDLHQSKVLSNILPLESADMYWSFGNIKFMDNDYDSNVVQHIPAWSLSALLELMPKELELLSNECNFVPVLSRFCEDTDKFICCYDNGAMEHWYIEKEPLDAVYNMVCWLLENGYIK